MFSTGASPNTAGQGVLRHSGVVLPSLSSSSTTTTSRLRDLSLDDAPPTSPWPTSARSQLYHHPSGHLGVPVERGPRNGTAVTPFIAVLGAVPTETEPAIRDRLLLRSSWPGPVLASARSVAPKSHDRSALATTIRLARIVAATRTRGVPRARSSLDSRPGGNRR